MAPQSQTQTIEIASLSSQQQTDLLDSILDATVQGNHSKAIADVLERRVELIRGLLPDSLKDQADRFVKRACLYFSRKPELEECTLQSKIKAILDAAELGLAIDGRLCHAVSYNIKFKDEKNVERWRKEVQCQPDYKGLAVVGRRTGQIIDISADVVRKSDHFVHGRKGPTCYLEHTYAPENDRGDVIAAYAIIKLPDGDWRYELMQVAELDAIKKRSKSKSGPWVTDEAEMQKKTVVRRALKLYCDDPGVAKAMEIDERDYGDDDGAWIPQQNGRVKSAPLDLSPPPRTKPQPKVSQETQQPQDDDEPPLEDREAPAGTVEQQLADKFEQQPSQPAGSSAPPVSNTSEQPPAGGSEQSTQGEAFEEDPNALNGLEQAIEQAVQSGKLSEVARVAQDFSKGGLLSEEQKRAMNVLITNAKNTIGSKKSTKKTDKLFEGGEPYPSP